MQASTMLEDPRSPDGVGLPVPRIEFKRWTPSLIWLVPIAAAIVGLFLLINAWRSAGPRITISFQTAEGLVVGKTLVKNRDVIIGHVTAIDLSADHARVVVTADLLTSAEYLATSNTKFWVERPRIGVGWVSGLDTLLSGAFIGAEGGDSKTPRKHFTGLETPPPLTQGRAGKRVVLHADDFGSVSLGAPVYFRRFQVGRVIDQQLEADGTGARITLFIDAPNDRFITRATRFWNASGIDVTLSANGLKLKTQSLASVLAGGVAFETAPVMENPLPAPSGAQFVLFKDETVAMTPPDGEPHYVRMRFKQSLRGLSIGAPVEFIGVNIGSVISIDLDYEARDQSFPVIVTAVLYPRRMGRAYDTLVQQGAAESDDKMARLVGQLVVRGLRAQPRPGNLLTGQLYIALDFIPGARTARFEVNSRPLQIPTTRGSIDELQLRFASIVNKIDNLPFAHIARHLDDDLSALHGSLEQINGQVLPTVQSTLGGVQNTLGIVDRTLAEDSPARDTLRQTLAEAQRTMRSVRSLADYLNHHPEALLRGRHAGESDTDVSSATEAAAQ
jgi:paraquat-inducible protein B